MRGAICCDEGSVDPSPVGPAPTSCIIVMGAEPSRFVEEEVTVTNDVDGYEIQAKLSFQSSKKIRATALFLHGGMFSTYDRNSNAEVTKALVKECGLAVLTADFRDGSSTTYRTGKTLTDLKVLARYLQSRFPEHPMGVVGSSSGGYFAMMLCNAMGANTTNPKIRFCIPLAPVAHPQARGIYLKHCIEHTTPMATGKDLYSVRHTPERAESILNNQLKFFESFKCMAEAADFVQKNISKVPTLLIVGASDKNIPLTVIQNVQQHWASRTIVLGDGVGHELCNVPPTESDHSNYLPDINRFLANVLDDGGYTSTTTSRPWCV